MNKKGEIPIIGLSIAVILGIIALGVGFGLISNQTTTTTITKDSFTAKNSTCVQVTDNCIQSLTSVTNGTKTYTGNFTLCGDNPNLNGLILYPLQKGAKLHNSVMNATYTEISCGYLSGTTRTIVNYVPLLWAVAILALVAGFIGVGSLMNR